MSNQNTSDAAALPPLPCSPDDFWTATENWIRAVEKRYENCDRNDLTQIFMRGPFAGMSEREVACFADGLRQSTERFPLHRKSGTDSANFRSNVKVDTRDLSRCVPRLVGQLGFGDAATKEASIVAEALTRLNNDWDKLKEEERRQVVDSCMMNLRLLLPEEYRNNLNPVKRHTDL